MFKVTKIIYTSIKHHKGFDVSRDNHMNKSNSPTIYACVNDLWISLHILSISNFGWSFPYTYELKKQAWYQNIYFICKYACIAQEDITRISNIKSQEVHKDQISRNFPPISIFPHNLNVPPMTSIKSNHRYHKDINQFIFLQFSPNSTFK